MTQPMFPAQTLRVAAAACRALDEAATDGPWRAEQRDDPDGEHVLWAAATEDGRTPLAARTLDAGHHSQAEADVAVAVLMRQVPRYLADLLETAAEQGRVSAPLLSIASLIVEHADNPIRAWGDTTS